MWLIFLSNSLPWNMQTNRQYPNWALTNDCINSLLCWKLIRFDNLDKTDNSLPTFSHREEIYQLKPKSIFYNLKKFLFWTLPNFYFNNICPNIFMFYRETHRWRLSWFSFMWLLLNHSIAKWLSCSNLLIKVFKSLSQAK